MWDGVRAGEYETAHAQRHISEQLYRMFGVLHDDLFIRETVRLSNASYLNDIIINEFLGLANEQMLYGKKCIAVSTFFVNQLEDSDIDMERVRRYWKPVSQSSSSSPRIGITRRRRTVQPQWYECDQIFVPIHVASKSHWLLMVIHFKQRQIMFVDSLVRLRAVNTERRRFLVQQLLDFLKLEYVREKKEQDDQSPRQQTNPVDLKDLFDIQSWIIMSIDCKQQDDVCSCGVFTCLVCVFFSNF